MKSEIKQKPILKISNFFEAQRYEKAFEDDFLSFCHFFIVHAFERFQDYQVSVLEKGKKIDSVIVFILDNVSLMNEIDWKFY
jgi:hypothetical protein